MNPMSFYKECKECSQHLNCYGGNQISPIEGFSRYALDSEEILRCFRPNNESCLGGDFENQLGQCAPGYSGFLCGQCKDNYYRDPDFSCK